jgi:hypothetical protein
MQGFLKGFVLKRRFFLGMFLMMVGLLVLDLFLNFLGLLILLG